MGKNSRCLCFTVIVFLAVLDSPAWGFTDPLDVSALRDIYIALKYPSQLKGWRLNGGDPCGESWRGVSCANSSVIYLYLNGLKLNGYLGSLLHHLHHLKQLDISHNNIVGEIPHGLPPNATHLNLACNNLSLSIPHSISSMKNLRHLNLSHNSLSGPIGNVFTGLQNLIEMDLSYNNFTGDLPSSFESLLNIARLFLQNNKFTGSVIYLASLPLTDLNIQDNNFSGVIPAHFQFIPNLWIGGNSFHVGDNTAPWHFPLDNMPRNQNIRRPPEAQSNAIENYPFSEVVERKNRLRPAEVAGIVVGGALVATLAVLFVVQMYRSGARKPRSLNGSNDSQNSLPISTVRDSSPALEEIQRILSISSPPNIHTLPTASISCNIAERNYRRRSFSEKCSFPAHVKVYSITELQFATDSFSDDNLIGEGSLGPVYRAELDGQTLTVKNINMVALSFKEEEHFLDVICTVSRLRHPSIVTLYGYCVENGQHYLVYEYIRNLSLDDVLHSEAYKPLQWGLRIRIALGVARALNYLHSAIPHPVAHTNLKAANILLDEEFKPHICDCGLAVLRPFTINSLKIKASEIAIDDTGYVAPEHGQPGIDRSKIDIYAFGVLLLELLTGRRPFDNSRPKEEQSLVKWASSQLHDRESLEQMTDPTIRTTIASKVLSQFADIVSLCIQPEKEFRPPMCEIVESLKCLVNKPIKARCGEQDGEEVDHLDRSFRSTHTRFLCSPAASYSSA